MLKLWLLLEACFCVSWGCPKTVSKHNQT
ncbi:MAG: hypothetical protein RLZZ469_2012, partial [Bacteroidota bacterium]